MPYSHLIHRKLQQVFLLPFHFQNSNWQQHTMNNIAWGGPNQTSTRVMNRGNSGAISGAKSGATNQSLGATNQAPMGTTSQVSSSIQGNSGAISGAKSGATN